MKKRLLTMILVFAMVMGLAGCGTKNNSKIEISMYLWDKNMTRELTPWLEKKFPDIEFTFVSGFNSMDYYSYLNDHGELPDIITCRRFSLNDAAHLSNQLMDLSETKLVGTFYDSYIENNRETSGAIRWLPMCAEVDGLMANKDLFDKYNIPLPTNYQEFVAAMKKFEDNGVQGFMTDFSADYTCLEIMQGCAIPELKSLEGTTWRSKYESEKKDGEVGLDDKVWPTVFKKFDQFIKDIGITSEMMTDGFSEIAQKFNKGEIAVMRATANDCVYSRNTSGQNTVMLPYFGETSEDNWILTYPVLQTAVNKKVEEDKEKEEAVLKVLEAMYSEKGQQCLSSGNAVLSYNKNVDIEINDALSNVKDCIDSNHMYMRLASTEIFAISKDVAGKMIKGEYGPEEAYQDFNTQLTTVGEVETPEVIIKQKKSYSYGLGEHGNPASSSVLNTLRKGTDKQIAIGFWNVATSSVFKGDYTQQKLLWLFTFKAFTKEAQYTGEDIISIMEWLVNKNENGNNPIRHKNFIPVTSGMEYSMKDNGDGTYTLDQVTINGKAIDKKATYSVLLVGEDDCITNDIYCGCPMPENLKAKYQDTSDDYRVVFVNAVKKCGQFQEPSDYVTIEK